MFLFVCTYTNLTDLPASRGSAAFGSHLIVESLGLKYI